MRAGRRLAIPVGLLIAAAAAASPAAASEGSAQDPTADGWSRHRFPILALDLPPTWRQMTVDELVRLRDQLPNDMREVGSYLATGLPSHFFVVGEVDRWLREGFDGRALVVVVQDHERPIDEAGLEAVRRHWQGFRDARIGTRELLESSLTTLGPDAHPVIECSLLTRPPSDARPYRALEFYTSTSGRELILSFRTWEDEFGAVLPTFRKMSGTLIFARPPKEPEELADRLLDSALVGAIVGIVLLGMFLMLRRRTA